MPLVQIKGLRYHKLDVHDDSADTHSCMRIAWKADISYLIKEALQKYLGPTSDMPYGQSSMLQPKKGG